MGSRLKADPLVEQTAGIMTYCVREQEGLRIASPTGKLPWLLFMARLP